MDASFFHPGDNFREVVAFLICVLGYVEDFFGAQFDADLTTLAPFWDQIYLALGDMERIQV
jgi:hypothetical protein